MIKLDAEVKISPAATLNVLSDHQLVSRTSAKPCEFDLNPCPLTTDSRTLENNGILLIYRGVAFDPHELLATKFSKAITTARLVVLEDSTYLPANCKTPWIEVSDGRAAWSWLCSAALGHPGTNLRLHGVTGTNGKTSTVWMAKELCRASGHPFGTLGTLGALIDDEQVSIKHTTPDPPLLFSFLAECRARGVQDVFLEISSHAISQKKVDPLRFSTLIFTSFSQDHLDFHGSLDAYFQAKWHFFARMGRPDASRFAAMKLRGRLQEATARETQIEGGLSLNEICFYGSNETADCRWQVTLPAINSNTQVIDLRLPDKSTVKGPVPYYGPAMLDNFAAANLIIKSIPTKNPEGQKSPADSFASLTPEWTLLRSVPGRFETVSLGDNKKETLVLVDYAHTPDALEQALQLSRDLGTHCLWVIFGCGGDRDQSKRATMGSIAAQIADHVVITSDNPRTEDPAAIIKNILLGIDQVQSKTATASRAPPQTQQAGQRSFCSTRSVKTIQDRSLAISYTIEQAQPNDTVLIAGKGHETYQVVGTDVLPFDDRQVAAEALARKESS